jgi:hypothetical protein
MRVDWSFTVQSVLGNRPGAFCPLTRCKEFEVQTPGYAAGYGRNPGGQVEFTARSGINKIHRTLIDFLRNMAFETLEVTAHNRPASTLNTPTTIQEQEPNVEHLQIKETNLPEAITRLADEAKDIFYFFNDQDITEPTRRVNLSLALSMLEELDTAARKLKIGRHALIKTLIRQALDQHYLATTKRAAAKPEKKRTASTRSLR